MRFRVVPYKKFSDGAKKLASAISELVGYRVLRGPAKPNKINIIWGRPNDIGADKLRTFEAFAEHNVSCPKFTEDRKVALKWINENKPVVARRLLHAQEGRGAVYAEAADQLPQAPLFVQYVPKKKEFRVHVWDGAVVLVQEKRKRRGTRPDPKIRSHANDWVFCVEDVVEPPDLREVALSAATAVGHSGAVDVVYNEKRRKCYALEINSAPGLTESTARAYARTITR
jgi:hypothetical protein